MFLNMGSVRLGSSRITGFELFFFKYRYVGTRIKARPLVFPSLINNFIVLCKLIINPAYCLKFSVKPSGNNEITDVVGV